MKKIVMGLGLIILGTQAQAAVYTTVHTGNGKAVLNAKTEIEFTNKLTVEMNTDTKEAKFIDEVTMANGEKHDDTYTVKFGALKSLTVERDGKVVGSGYCFHQDIPNGGWCNMAFTSVEGLQENMNVYYDGQNDTVYRMGDVTFPGGKGYWSVALSKLK